MRTANMKPTPSLNELLWGFVSLMVISELVYSDDQLCSKIKFPNGFVKYAGRKSSQMARFICRKDFELIGGKYAKCKNGEWDMTEPFCAKSGCEFFPALKNGMQFYLKNKTQVMFFCHPQYRLIGPSRAICNGKEWNVAQPQCQSEQNEVLALSCDFETPSICGWVNDPEHDFDWKRKCLGTPSGILGTGPSFDHTHGSGQLGYYMYIESTSRLENDSARLISPLYGGNLSKNNCFVFYYHMYGKSTGSLRVYVHPENVEFKKVMEDTTLAYKRFEKNGNQGNFWHRGYFDLVPMESNFQIVIEGIRGSSYTSDIAIDDVSILQGDNCTRFRSDAESTTPPLMIYTDSCLNRCGTNNSIKTFDGESIICQCHQTCDASDICCLDYRDLCLFGLDTEESGRKSLQTSDTLTTDNFGTTEIDKYKPPMLPTPEKATATRIPFIDKSSDIKSKLTVNQTTTEKTPIKLPQSSTNVTNSSIITTTPALETITNVTKTTLTTIQNNQTTLGIVQIDFNDETKYEIEKSNTTNDKINSGKILPENDTKTTQVPESVSKHFGHYGRHVDGKLKSTTSVYNDDEVVFSKDISKNKMEKISAYREDSLHTENKLESKTSPLIIISIVIVVAVLVVIPVVIRFNLVSNHCYNLSKGFTNLHQRWTRTRNLSENQADMRFLVQDEELENYAD